MWEQGSRHMYEVDPPLYNDGGKAYVETETIHQPSVI